MEIQLALEKAFHEAFPQVPATKRQQPQQVPDPDTASRSSVSRRNVPQTFAQTTVLRTPEEAEPTTSPHPEASGPSPPTPPSPSLRWLFPSAAPSAVELETRSKLPEGDAGQGSNASVDRDAGVTPSSHQHGHHVVDILSKEGGEEEDEENKENEEKGGEESANTPWAAERLHHAI